MDAPDNIDELELLAKEPRRKLAARVAKHKKLIANLRGDLARHGDATRWKRFGDLLLASPNARREGDRVIVVDYFDETTPTIEIEGEKEKPLTEVAEDYFRKYTKARNAAKIIAERIETTDLSIAGLEKELARIDTAVQAGDVEYLSNLSLPKTRPTPISKKRKAEAKFKGARRFISSDGFEILVGKKAVDNDFLTFRIAKSLDAWLHAADYPGSHVIIRSKNREPIPQKTLLEAAGLAAFYSDAREMPKAAVNHTLKKFVNKPKRSAPGLVSLSSFKTLLVEPIIPESVINKFST